MRDTVRGKLQNNVKKISRPNFPDKASSLGIILLIIFLMIKSKYLYERKAPLDGITLKGVGLALSPVKMCRVNKLQRKRNPILPSNINIKYTLLALLVEMFEQIFTNIYEENLQNFVCAYLAGLQNMMECFCFIRIEKQMQFP